mgnify:CR=1 FL=1
MGYTTVTKVRQASGFVGNNNVSDAYVSAQITRADSIVNSFISSIYTLPLKKHYTQTVVFSGTGSGAGTLTMIVGGLSFAVTIASSLSASQAADRFRTAALNNVQFVTDGLGSGATVNLYTIDGDDSAQLTITSTDPQTVAGITATGGTVTEIAVPMVEYLSTEIACAQLLIIEYSAEAQGTDKDGYKRMAAAKAILKGIQSKLEKIFDFASVELAMATTANLSFYPTELSRTDADDPTENRMTMNGDF